MVTTIIPTIGRDTLWSRALPSVYAQTRDDWRCIVVGDGVDIPPVADGRVTVMRIDHDRPTGALARWRYGGAAAFNAGLDRVDTEWVSYLADDDAYRPDHHERLLAASDGADLVYGQSQPHRPGDERPLAGRLFGDRWPLEPHDVVQGSYILRASLGYRATEPAGESWDADWWHRLLALGLVIRRAEAVVHDYYPAPENAHLHGAHTW